MQKEYLLWGFRFLHNARNKKNKISGPLTTQELEKADTCLIRRSQIGVDLESKEAQQLGLTQFEDHVIRCVGRISGEQPIFIPRYSIYCHKLTAEVHKKVGHKGVNMMMAFLREKVWIPRLRAVLKKLKRSCETCRIMTTQPYPRPNVGRLPDYRTTASYPFDQQDKAYIVIFSCGTSRAVHFTTTRTMLASEFIDRLNEFIAARSRPKRMISDNAQTFRATAEFIKNLRKSEELHEYLAEHEIQWEFILTKSPWRGAFYEQLNRDLKKMLYQKLGRSYPPFSGFSRVVKDTEIVFNNRPIQYVEDELGPRVLTPNRIIHGRDVYLLEELEEADTPSKMEKRIRAAKEVMWKRWQTEYVRALRERHDVTKTTPFHPEIGEVVLVVADSKNRHEWHHGLVCELLKGKDGVVRGVRMIVRNKVMERPLQLVCPLEIRSTMSSEELNKRIKTANKTVIDTKVEEELKRPKRRAGDQAKQRIKDLASEQDLFV